MTAQSPLGCQHCAGDPANLSHAIAGAARLLSAFGGNAELAEAADAKRRQRDRRPRSKRETKAIAGEMGFRPPLAAGDQALVELGHEHKLSLVRRAVQQFVGASGVAQRHPLSDDGVDLSRSK